ncbi:hypothetical protein [Streptomyces sp. NPDC018045]|uniref:hypothetical protein n=1 Tax=Streptomyces sp. NPDC018045 TaxID=3365037 RepID=UPI003797FC35
MFHGDDGDDRLDGGGGPFGFGSYGGPGRNELHQDRAQAAERSRSRAGSFSLARGRSVPSAEFFW